MSSPRAHDAVSLELAGAQLGVKIWDDPILRLLICRYSMPSTLNNILQTSSDAFRTAVTVRYHEVDYATCSRIDHSNAVRCLIVPVNQLRLVLHAATYPNLKVIEVALGIEFKMVITLERSGFADIRATAEITEKHWGSRCRKVIATGLLDNVLTCIPPQWNTKTYFTAYTDLDGKSFSRTGFWAQPISDLYLFGHDPIDNERMFGQLRPEDNIHSIMMNLVLDSALLEALGSLLDTLEAKGVKRIGIACGGGIDAVKHALVAMDKFDPRKRWFDGFHTVAIILHEIDWNGNGRVVTELSLGFIQGMFRTRPAPEATRHPSIVEVVVDPCQPDTYKRIFDPLEQPKILRFIAEVAPVLLWVGGPLADYRVRFIPPYDVRSQVKDDSKCLDAVVGLYQAILRQEIDRVAQGTRVPDHVGWAHIAKERQSS